MGTCRQQPLSGTWRGASLLRCVAAAVAIAALGWQSASGDELSSASGLQTSQYDSSQPAEERPPRPAAAPLSHNASEAVQRRGEGLHRESGIQELSVEPGSQPLLPADAPAWIGALPDTSGEVHYVHVGGLIAETPQEAATLLDEALVAAVGRYVEETVLGRAGAATVLRRQLTPDFIWKNLIDDPQGYMARLNTSGIPMYQKWVTVSITPQQRDMITAWNRQALQRKRLGPLGVGTLGILACVGALHLLFKGRKPQP